MKSKKFDREFLLGCAAEVLEWIGLQDPAYEMRIDITRTEYHLDDLQILACYCARVLDAGEHMVVPEREFTQPGYVGHMGPRECEICNETFSPSFTTATVCEKQSCLDERAKRLDEAAESKGK